MAGRSKTKAKRVGALEDQAFRLALELFRARPQTYEDHPNSSDPLQALWRCAVEDAILSSVRIMLLADKLREKAKIDDPGPAMELSFVLEDNDQEMEFVETYENVRMDVIHGALPT